MPQEHTPIYHSLVSLGGANQFVWQSGALFQIITNILDCRDVASVGNADFPATQSIGQSQLWTICYSIHLISIDAGALGKDSALFLTVALQEWVVTGAVSAFTTSQVQYLPTYTPHVSKGRFRVESDGARLAFDNTTGADYVIWWRAWGKVL